MDSSELRDELQKLKDSGAGLPQSFDYRDQPGVEVKTDPKWRLEREKLNDLGRDSCYFISSPVHLPKFNIPPLSRGDEFPAIGSE